MRKKQNDVNTSKGENKDYTKLASQWDKEALGEAPISKQEQKIKGENRPAE
jgi:hypothetical protein